MEIEWGLDDPLPADWGSGGASQAGSGVKPCRKWVLVHFELENPM